jgi:restriction system protein
MAVPDYQRLMLPLLKIAGDGNEHGVPEVIETLAQQLGLSETDRNELLPSGSQRSSSWSGWRWWN